MSTTAAIAEQLETIERALIDAKDALGQLPEPATKGSLGAARVATQALIDRLYRLELQELRKSDSAQTQWQSSIAAGRAEAFGQVAGMLEELL